MKIKLLYFWATSVLLAVATGCSHNDIAPEDDTKPGTEETETKGVSFIAGNEGTRTSLNYDNSNFYWEDGDKIYVKDEDKVFQHSSNSVSGNTVSTFKFMMPGRYTKNSYTVYYPGKNGTDNKVTIASSQTQNGPDNTFHFGTVGDCGTGKANLQNGQYKFTLVHSPAYLCFKPIYDHPLADTYVTKIEVTADKNIAGNYTLKEDGTLTGTGSSNTITLTPKDGSSNKGFKMVNDAEKKTCASGRMFMVIMPGTYVLTIKYYITDTKTGVSGVITKKFNSFEYVANRYYDMPSKLTVRYYGDDYYMWDAKKDYWFGHTNEQPKEMGTPGSNYPTSSDAQRWCNVAATFPTAANNTAKSCPNANEITWYCMKGDPHWDNTTVWSVWEHLYTGGMWFKKESVIASEQGKTLAYLTNKSYDGKNRIQLPKIYETPPSNKDPKKGIPAKLSDYFFLPAMGEYANGKLESFCTYGFYWAKTPEPYFAEKAYNLFFLEGEAGLSNGSDRDNGYKLWTPK